MPKSPSYGAGNVNMKGKKYKLRHCGCCWCIDFRDDVLKKEHKKEMKEYGRIAQLDRASVYETEG